MKKNILVTGCTRGLGLTTCVQLLEKGFQVFGVGKTETAEVKQLSNDYNNSFHFLQYDLSLPDGIREHIFRNWITPHQQLHGLVNNAAVAYDDIITNLDTTKLRAMFEVNTVSPMVLTKYFIRQLLLHGNTGSIVHLSSISVHTGYKGLSMYAGSKGALEAFSKNTAREWGEKGIRSNCLVAGFMETDMSASLTPDQKTRIYNRTSSKKATTTQSVAATVCYLLSNESESITGQNIFVDSGTI